jgi:transcription antitermination factor NusG
MEYLAATLLEEQLDVHTYYPEVMLHRRDGFVRGPFFPGYLFVACDLQTTAQSAIDSTVGVVRLVRFQSEPRAVPDNLVEQIRLRIDAINAAGGLPVHQFHVGDPVRIAAGPMQGLEGIFDGPMTAAERVMVLLRFLGGERRVNVAADAIEPNSNPTPSIIEKRPRRSRGTGRPIQQQVLARRPGPAA